MTRVPSTRMAGDRSWPAETQDSERIPGPERHHVVDCEAGEKRPDTGAERQARFESPQQEPPAHDAHRVAGGHEDQGEKDGGARQAGERTAQRIQVQPAREQPDETRGDGEAERQLQPPHPRPTHPRLFRAVRRLADTSRSVDVNPIRSLTR